MKYKKKLLNKELILAVQDGNETAFEELYNTYYKLVYFIAYELCRNDADAKDVVQETFIQVKKSIHSLKEVDHFKPWLNRITINKCKNLFRGNKDKIFDMDDSYFQNSLVEERNYMLPEESVHMESDKHVVHDMIMELPMIQREALLLRYFQKFSMKEIAFILEIPEGTVKTRLLYGKNNLKKLVDEYEKTNDTKINFRGDSTIITAFALSFSSHHLLNTLPSSLMIKMQSCGSSIMSSTIGKLTLISIMSFTGGIVLISYNQIKQSDNSILSQPNIQTIEDTNARTFYFELMNWASCRQDMEAKTKEEITSVVETYIKLKQGNSAYYKRLVSDEWTVHYEELLENSKK